METKLKRIAKVARKQPKERFASLVHLVNEEMLENCHIEMDGRKTPGVDGVTKEDYGENLQDNLKDLVARMKRQAYKPKPVKRVYIEKENGGQRPIGIPAYEDKLVQSAVAKILSAVYEEDFLDCSFGFRPKRNCHDALRLLGGIINKPEINYVVDTDIKGFFDNVDHEWLMKFLDHRIQDPNLQRLVARFLKAGIKEDRVKYESKKGTPQGGVCSPVLANLYLHHVVDLWFEKKMRKVLKGKAYMVRYADDIIFCFQYEEDIKYFYKSFVERLKKFELELSEEKTNIVKLDKDDGDDDYRNSTFDFLGFTHYMGKCKDGIKRIKRKTSKNNLRRSISRCKEWIKKNKETPIKGFMKRLNRKLKGTYNYFAVSDNSRSLTKLYREIRKLVFKWLNRRSQKRSYNWEGFIKFLSETPIVKPRIKVNLYEIKVGSRYLE